jgi:hypothetical protein
MNTRFKSTATAAAIAAAGAVLTLTVAACGSTTGTASGAPAGTDTQAPPVQPTSVAPVADIAGGATPATEPPAPAQQPVTHTVGTTSGTPECKASTLRLSFGAGDAGMSQQERVLRFTNVGSRTCAIVGFPGVSYVTGDDGHQVGAPAVRTGTIGAQVNLAPGAVASTVLHSADPGVFDPSTCQPTAVRGFRIYAPDDTAAMFISLPAGEQACAGSTPEPELSVVTIKVGLGDPDQ